MEKKMISTKPINFTSIEEISNNVDFYKNLFIKDGILVFRNANLSHENHINLHNVFKNSFNWYINSGQSYTEDHSRLTTNDSLYVDDNNKVMLSWHVEHPYYSNPIIAATWNMHKFTTDPENGKTYFVDMENLFKTMPEEYKEFSKKCALYNTYKDRVYSLIGYHWISNNPVLRISHVFENLDHFVDLKYVDNVEPTEEDVKIYKEMIFWIQKEVTTNTDIRIVHKWNQGDIVMPDIYKMCHSVSGGFSSKDREFTGIWGHRFENFENFNS
jgi:alpha-ketoglutarate-dependent taurine dioxygenase